PRADRHLARLLCKLEAGRQHVDGSLRSRNNLQQLHDVRRAEEVQADKPLRVRQAFKDELWVEIRCVGGEYRLFGTDLGKFRKHGALDVQILEHGLDDEVATAKIRIIGGSRETGQPRIMLLLRQAAFGKRSGIGL